MNVAAGPKLAAAVTNAGGIGVIGGVGYSPDMMREQVLPPPPPSLVPGPLLHNTAQHGTARHDATDTPQVAELKSYLHDKNAPFGVDLLLPKVGAGARATNHDYTKGKLDELIGVVIESGAKLFVSAVGVPPKPIVERLHAAGIVYMNMIGHPKHVAKCLDAGADIVCAQGSEGGGHTGDVPTSVLVPTVVDLVRGHTSPLSGRPVQVLAAGGIFNGKSLAAALAMGASAVWVGTRFILADEAGAPLAHQEAVRTAGFSDTVRTVIFTGRPLRVRRSAYIDHWEAQRRDDIAALTARGIVPVEHDIEQLDEAGQLDDDTMDNARPFLMGKVAAVVSEKKPAKAIVDEMVAEAVEQLRQSSQLLSKL